MLSEGGVGGNILPSILPQRQRERVRERVCVWCNMKLQSQRGQITCRDPQTTQGSPTPTVPCPHLFPKHLHPYTTEFQEAGQLSCRRTLAHAEHSHLCTLSPFQGVGAPINTPLQGLGGIGHGAIRCYLVTDSQLCLVLSSGVVPFTAPAKLKG